MPQTESSIEGSFVRWCKKHKIKTYKLVLNPGAGWPDRAVMFAGNRVCWLEFKTKTGRLSDAQEAVIDLMSDHGHLVYVVRSLKEAKLALAEFAKTYGTAFLSTDSQEPPP
jgi:methyl coenzyme M reductase subunit C